MSRGFVKEGDQEEAPIIPPRAALPAGMPNYVTPAGYEALILERKELELERERVPEDNDTEHRRAVMVIDAKMILLDERISSAQVINVEEQPQDEVRFGALVKFHNGEDNLQYQIVGVDEADLKTGKIAFIAPIVRAMMGKKVGETVEFNRGNRQWKLKILNISYPS